MGKNTRLTKPERLKNALLKAVENVNGNRVRHLVRIIAKAYEENPKGLREYFLNPNENELIAGISTSAYHLLTLDMGPAQSIEYGGLGAILERNPIDLNPNPITAREFRFGRRQLHFARLSGDALWHSINSGDALWHSINSGDALSYSINSGDALSYSINSGRALQVSTNNEDALAGSENIGSALAGSRNKGSSLVASRNSEEALLHSGNSEDTLWRSINSGRALWHSRNIGRALSWSINSGRALQYSENSGYSLSNSEDSEDALVDSVRSLFNRGIAMITPLKISPLKGLTLP